MSEVAHKMKWKRSPEDGSIRFFPVCDEQMEVVREILHYRWDRVTCVNCLEKRKDE